MGGAGRLGVRRPAAERHARRPRCAARQADAQRGTRAGGLAGSNKHSANAGPKGVVGSNARPRRLRCQAMKV